MEFKCLNCGSQKIEKHWKKQRGKRIHYGIQIHKKNCKFMKQLLKNSIEV